MKTDLTDITVVMDRSGSMSSCAVEAEGGLNHFIEEQKQAAGDAVFLLVQFDDHYDVVCEGVPIQDAPVCKLEPRGMTALLDAVGKTINTVGLRLAAMDEADRPGLVIMVILTDGMENSSQEFTKAQVKDMIEHQQSKYNWKFIFLGANQDAFSEGGSIGIQASSTANFDIDKIGVAYQATSASISRVRASHHLPAAARDIEYTDEERKAMKKKG